MFDSKRANLFEIESTSNPLSVEFTTLFTTLLHLNFLASEDWISEHEPIVYSFSPLQCLFLACQMSSLRVKWQLPGIPRMFTFQWIPVRPRHTDSFFLPPGFCVVLVFNYSKSQNTQAVRQSNLKCPEQQYCGAKEAYRPTVWTLCD